MIARQTTTDGIAQCQPSLDPASLLSEAKYGLELEIVLQQTNSSAETLASTPATVLIGAGSDQYVIQVRHWNALRARVVDTLREIKAAQYRDALGIGRKRAVQILEFFDRVGFTSRVNKESHQLREDSGWFMGTHLRDAPDIWSDW